MNSEKDVIYFDFTGHSNIRIHHTLKIIDRITIEPGGIKHGKLHWKSSDIFGPVVLNGLWIETERPRKKGDPAKYLWKDIPFLVSIIFRVS